MPGSPETSPNEKRPSGPVRLRASPGSEFGVSAVALDNVEGDPLLELGVSFPWTNPGVYDPSTFTTLLYL